MCENSVINILNNKKLELEHNLNVVSEKYNEAKEQYRQEYACVKNKVDEIIRRILTVHGFDCETHISETFGRSYRITCGKPDWGRTSSGFMFHSTFSIEYTVDGKIEVNCGTSGGYSFERDQEQVLRVYCIADIWKNVRDIESEIASIDTSKYKIAYMSMCDVEWEQNKLKKELSSVEYEIAKETVSVVGTKVSLTDKNSMLIYDNPFKDACYCAKINFAELVKVTNVYMFFDIYTNDGKIIYSYKVKKDIIVSSVARNQIYIVE